MVLVNCGATVYIRDELAREYRGVRFLVLDAHRPIHQGYNNAGDGDTVLLLPADDPQARADIPVAFDSTDDLDVEGVRSSRREWGCSVEVVRCDRDI